MLQRIRESLEKRDEGFTLIELLVVIIIIGILAAIAIPVFLNQRRKAWDSAAKSDVKNMSTAQETYLTDEGAYTDVVDPDLTDLGFSRSQDVHHAACGTGTGYVVVGQHANSANVWFFDSSSGQLDDVTASDTAAEGGTFSVDTDPACGTGTTLTEADLVAP